MKRVRGIFIRDKTVILASRTYIVTIEARRCLLQYFGENIIHHVHTIKDTMSC